MRENMPFITICMPTYNVNWCLKEVLQSIYNIDYPKKLIRLVFVDCCSTDGTWEILKKFKEKYEQEYETIILLQDPQRGSGHAYNVCLKYVKGWIFWAESDRILPPEVLTHLLEHFRRDPKVGWAHCAWTRKNPTFYEKIMLSRFIPKGYRCVDEIEIACSLVRPEAIEVFGSFYEDGGTPFDSYEAAEQFVRLRKAGWKIINDGQLADRCIHLVHEGGEWGRLAEGKNYYNRLKTCLKRLTNFAYYYLTKPPKRPVHEMIRAGDVKLALKIAYWFILPYVLVIAIIFQVPLLLIYPLPAFLIYAYETRQSMMKFITPFFQIVRWTLIAQGYVFFLFKLAAKKLLGY